MGGNYFQGDTINLYELNIFCFMQEISLSFVQSIIYWIICYFLVNGGNKRKAFRDRIVNNLIKSLILPLFIRFSWKNDWIFINDNVTISGKTISYGFLNNQTSTLRYVMNCLEERWKLTKVLAKRVFYILEM